MRVGARPDRATVLWLIAALGFAALFVARSMAPAFAGPGIVQDDARQHVFWMLRWTDPALFQDDLIADYFQSQAPPGYTALYWLLTRVVDPLAASKLVPVAVGMASALFTFLFARRLHRVPSAAFLAAVLGSWYVWQYDDLATGSPRAFLLPFVAAQLWLLASGRRWPAVAAAVAGALFYPTAGALMVAILGARLLRLDRWPPRLSGERSDWLAACVAGGVVLVVLLPTLLGGRFGPTVTAEAARAMPEFGPGGRNAFFFADPYRFWVESYRGGLDLRVRDALFPSVPILYELAALAALLPGIRFVQASRRAPVILSAAKDLRSEDVRRSFAALRMTGEFRMTGGLTELPSAPSGAPLGAPSGAPCGDRRRAPEPPATLLLHVLLASFGLFFLAHLLLFRLYLPARFVQWSVPLVLAVAAGLGLATLVGLLAASVKGRAGGVIAVGLPLALAVGLALYPARYDANVVPDRYPRISAYLRAQPPDTLVAAVPTEADSVPSFAHRRVLTAREYALAYHTGYYAEIAARTRDLIDAYYAESPRRVAEIAARHGIDVFLVNRAAFDRETFGDAWAGEFEPYVSQIAGQLRRSGRYALLDAARRCGVLTEGEVTVVPVTCFGGG